MNGTINVHWMNGEVTSSSHEYPMRIRTTYKHLKKRERERRNGHDKRSFTSTHSRVASNVRKLSQMRRK